ncbi:unnamed protein product [Peronospora destructor]|uniref:Uncharacterized protein n=1 Tax=Peronospora destructor TaxID=86335 RepID=A0AAV0V3I2_9STRA|nr:unnamed protein product [Peronospora destructor]
MGSLFNKRKNDGRTLRPRVRRATPLVDVGLAVLLGAVTGVYIFKDTMQRWQISEGEYIRGNGSEQGHSDRPERACCDDTRCSEE